MHDGLVELKMKKSFVGPKNHLLQKILGTFAGILQPTNQPNPLKWNTIWFFLTFGAKDLNIAWLLQTQLEAQICRLQNRVEDHQQVVDSKGQGRKLVPLLRILGKSCHEDSLKMV